MAPRKRSGPVESDDDNDSDAEQDLHSSQTSARKRRRVNENPPDSPDASSSLNEDENASASTPPSEVGVDDTDDDVAATQALRAKHVENMKNGNTPAECGILELVELTNFMCHERMDFKLGPLINFVCGKNGSGKSAILTAIVLCLGGKAAATNRGSNLKAFIKEGKDHAVIVCKIKNQGDGAYRPEDYGATIQVERHFSRTGTSGFKIKSTTGRVVSTKRADLDEICDHFALQIENPLNVLSQDQARQFIATSSASEKYKFFVKGVLLEQLDQDYFLIEEQLNNIEPKIETKEQDDKILEQRHLSAQNKLKLSQRHDGMREKLQEYRRQYTWAQIEAQEAIRDAFGKAITEADLKISNAELRVTELDATFQESDKLSGEAMEAYNEAEGEVTKLKDEKGDAKSKQDEAKKQVHDSQAEQRTIRSSLDEAKSIITSTEHEIQLEEQRLAELDGGGAAKRLQELDEARNAVLQAGREQNEHEERKAELEEDISTTRRAEGDAKQAVSSKEAEVHEHSRHLDNIRNRQATSDLAYHPKMPQLLAAIQKETRFQKRPVGPIGKHVKLLHPEWSSILEKSFGSTLNGFVVTNTADQRLLSQAMAKLQIKNIPVLIGNNHPLDTGPKEPDSSFLTVLRSLEIDNEAVRKILVIQHQIENTVLIPDQDEASQTLFRGNGRPRNVGRCFCFHPKVKNKGFVLHYRGNKPAQDPIDRFAGSPRMQTNLEAQIRFQEAALQDSKAQLLQLKEDFRRCQEKRVRAEQSLVRHKRQDRDLRIAVQEAQDEVERIQEAVNDSRTDQGKLDVLRQAVAEAMQKQSLHESSFMDSQNALDEKKKVLKNASNLLKEHDQRIQGLEAVAQEAQQSAQKASRKREFDLREKNAAISHIDDAKADRATLERKKTEKEAQIADFMEQARIISERVNVPAGETVDSLQKKYKRLNLDYEKAQHQIGVSREQAEANAAEASDIYQRAKRDLEHLKEIASKLKETLEERKKRWLLFRGFISQDARSQFTYLLSERSFRGRLKADHVQKLLELSVEPDITKRNGTGRGTKTLSGGEKSFTQICLLLALWEAMGSPIRCLDEFDVFMDAVNRTMSVKLLIETARNSPGKQYILISPGTKNDIPKAPDVHAIEIAPPERGQTRLELAPV